VFKNRVLTRISIAKRENVVAGWRRLHNEELHNLHASPNIAGMIISRMIKSAPHVALVGEVSNEYNTWRAYEVPGMVLLCD
jgi:hypothetical protein